MQMLLIWSIQEVRILLPRDSPGAVLFIILFRVAGPKAAKRRLGMHRPSRTGVSDFIYGIITSFVPVFHAWI